MQKIAQNGGMYQQMLMMQQQMLQMAQMVDQANGTNLAEQIAAGITGGVAPAPAAGGQAPSAKVEEAEALGGSEKAEASNTKKARQRVAESTDPT
jgi:ribosomal protein L12E/L44/L45/RPP1/RPP2